MNVFSPLNQAPSRFLQQFEAYCLGKYESLFKQGCQDALALSTSTIGRPAFDNAACHPCPHLHAVVIFKYEAIYYN